jgi:hypothetical protein
MQHIPATPLGQALAAIIQILIAAIAEHAREHPMLAGGCRASIRQLEKIARRFDAMVADWQASQATPRTPKPPTRPQQAIQLTTKRRSEQPPLRRGAAMANRAPSARAPPGLHPRAPPTPATRPAPTLRSPGHPRTGGARMYAAPYLRAQPSCGASTPAGPSPSSQAAAAASPRSVLSQNAALSA